MSTEAVAPKPSIEAEFMAAMKEPAPAAPVAPETPAAPAVDAQAPAPSEEPKPEAVAEAPKAEPPKPAELSLARRLATLAAAEKRQKDEAAARAARDAELAPAIERLTKAKGAKSKMEAARLALELDDEAEADLFLELHQKYEGNPAAKQKDPEVEFERKVKAKVDAEFKAREEAFKMSEAKRLDDLRADYTKATIDTLEIMSDDFPLVAIAPPSQVDITAIAEAMYLANGKTPPPEKVLSLIQDERQAKLEERRKAAETKKTSAKPAPVPTGETSGPKAKPIATNDVAVSPPRKLSIAEEFSAAFRAASGA